MPIRPEMKSLYPKNWKEIRAEILARADNRCEWKGCGLENGLLGCRDIDGRFWTFDQFANGEVADDICFADKNGELKKGFRIILTVAHVDQDPANNGEPGNRQNLMALCQYHHNRLDMPYRIKGKKERRAKRLGQQKLV